MKLTEILKKKTGSFLSIDFGQAFVKIACIKSLGPGFELLNYDSKEVLFTQENRAEIVNFINNFLESNAILAKEVYLTISDLDSIIIKHLILTAAPKDEIPEAIKWQLKGEIAFSLENALLDWQIVKEYTDEEGAKKIEMMAVVVAPEVIDKYLSIVFDCSLVPVRISSNPFNYAHILSYLQENRPVVAVLDIGHKHAILCIYKDNKLSFLRSLALSSGKLTQSLTGTLTTDKGKIEISYEKAKELIKNFGIPKDENLLLKDNIQAIHVISLMRPFLEGLVMELKRSFDYFSSSLKEENPSIIYITGGGANLKNLDWYLNKELAISVSNLPLPPGINAQRLGERLDNDQNQLMSALGAALAESGSINLLPPEIKTQKIEFIEKVSLRVTAITLAAIFLFSLFIVKFQERDYRNRLKNAKIHLQIIQEIRALKQKIDSREEFINKIQKNKVPVHGLLKQISAIVPNTLVLNEFILDLEAHSLVLRGVVTANESVAEPVLTDFMKKIEMTPFFTEANLIISKNLGGIQEFDIKCDLAH